MARRYGLILGVVLFGLGGPAQACLNDNESPAHEREFRSQYGGLAGLPTMDEFAHENPVSFQLLIGSGTVLLVGGFALAMKRTRARA